MDLYKDCDEYICHFFNSRSDWLKGRCKTIGGSDSSILIGLNPYKTNNQLWKEKMGLIETKEISNPAIEHGNDLEPVLRHWFQQSFKDYDVQYKENVILQSKEIDWRAYSPDGLLFHTKTHEKGIFEAKTTLIQNVNMIEEWNDKIPQHYYIQVLHGLLTTDFDFVILVAELRFAWNDIIQIRKYEIRKEEVLEDLVWLDQQEQKNYRDFYIKEKEPPLTLFL